jgi:hypothetical protein
MFSEVPIHHGAVPRIESFVTSPAEAWIRTTPAIATTRR